MTPPSHHAAEVARQLRELGPCNCKAPDCPWAKAVDASESLISAALEAARREERERCIDSITRLEPRAPDPSKLNPEEFYIQPEQLSEKLAGYKADFGNEIVRALRHLSDYVAAPGVGQCSGCGGYDFDLIEGADRRWRCPSCDLHEKVSEVRENLVSLAREWNSIVIGERQGRNPADAEMRLRLMIDRLNELDPVVEHGP